MGLLGEGSLFGINSAYFARYFLELMGYQGDGKE